MNFYLSYEIRGPCLDMMGKPQISPNARGISSSDYVGGFQNSYNVKFLPYQVSRWLMVLVELLQAKTSIESIRVHEI